MDLLQIRSRDVLFIFLTIIPGLAFLVLYFGAFLAPQGSQKSCLGGAVGVSDATEKGYRG